MRRRVAALLAAAGLLAVSAGTLPAHGQGDTTAVAVNTRDGADVFRLAFSIRRVLSETADTSNAAAAVSSCTDCTTVAISFQALLLLTEPEEVTPENLALALNIECSLCQTLASAYQFVLTTGGPVRFTAEGSRRLQEIHRQLLALRHADMGIVELQAEVDRLADEMREVLATELVPAGDAEPEPGGASSSSTTSTAGDGDDGTSGTSTSSTTTTTGSSTTTSTTSASSTTTEAAP